MIVVYNHLHPEGLPDVGTMVSAGDLLGFTRNYLVESIPEPTPRPCIAAHLDLQTFLATNYRGSDRSLQRQFNPLLLYSRHRADEHWLGNSSMQYPNGWNAFSLQGNTLDWIGVSYWTTPDAAAFITDIAQFLAGMSYEPPNCVISGDNCTVIPNDMN